MKKLITLFIIAAAGLVFASSAMAANANISDGTSLNGVLFKPSTKVTMLATATDTAYGVVAKHINGTIGYSTADTTSEIITWKDAGKGTVPTAVDVDGTGCTFATP